MLKIAADVDIIDAEVQKAVGEPIIEEIHEPNYNGHYTILVLHNEKAGRFQEVQIDKHFKQAHVIEEEIRVKPGEYVEAFTGANTAIGTLFLRFSSYEEMRSIMESYRSYVQVIVE